MDHCILMRQMKDTLMFSINRKSLIGINNKVKEGIQQREFLQGHVGKRTLERARGRYSCLKVGMVGR